MPDNALSDPMQTKLENVTREYEDFSYIVSHDLSAPIRHVREFTGLLIAGRRDSLNDEENDYIHYLEKSLQRLDEMQAALLSFSRVTTRAGAHRPVDLNQTLAAVLEDLSLAIVKYMPAMAIDPLPTLNVDPEQIRRVLHTLLSNAIKFQESERSQRDIAIRAKQQGDFWRFEVQDNGIGMAPAHQTEVFRIFRRLEPERYPGLGANLAIARKIIRRHGGDMGLTSTSGVGTTVWFTLPAAKEPETPAPASNPEQ